MIAYPYRDACGAGGIQIPAVGELTLHRYRDIPVVGIVEKVYSYSAVGTGEGAGQDAAGIVTAGIAIVGVVPEGDGAICHAVGVDGGADAAGGAVAAGLPVRSNRSVVDTVLHRDLTQGDIGGGRCRSVARTHIAYHAGGPAGTRDGAGPNGDAGDMSAVHRRAYGHRYGVLGRVQDGCIVHVCRCLNTEICKGQVGHRAAVHAPEETETGVGVSRLISCVIGIVEFVVVGLVRIRVGHGQAGNRGTLAIEVALEGGVGESLGIGVPLADADRLPLAAGDIVCLAGHKGEIDPLIGCPAVDLVPEGLQLRHIPDDIGAGLRPVAVSGDAAVHCYGVSAARGGGYHARGAELSRNGVGETAAGDGDNLRSTIRLVFEIVCVVPGCRVRIPAHMEGTVGRLAICIGCAETAALDFYGLKCSVAIGAIGIDALDDGHCRAIEQGAAGFKVTRLPVQYFHTGAGDFRLISADGDIAGKRLHPHVVAGNLAVFNREGSLLCREEDPHSPLRLLRGRVIGQGAVGQGAVAHGEIQPRAAPLAFSFTAIGCYTEVPAAGHGQSIQNQGAILGQDGGCRYAIPADCPVLNGKVYIVMTIWNGDNTAAPACCRDSITF